MLSEPNLMRLFLLVTLIGSVSCRTSTPTPPATSKLYGLPPSLLLLPGQTIRAKEGEFVVTEESRVWSDGAYREQLDRAVRRY